MAQGDEDAQTEPVGSVMRRGRSTWRIVEVLLDTGQRVISVDLLDGEAKALADDMRSRLRVIAVTVIDIGTGEAFTRPSRNLMAGAPRADEQEHLRTALVA